jgi:hypothetical protein
VENLHVSRYDVAALIIRFWWLVAGLGVASTGWLLHSIAAQIGI